MINWRHKRSYNWMTYNRIRPMILHTKVADIEKYLEQPNVFEKTTTKTIG